MVRGHIQLIAVKKAHTISEHDRRSGLTVIGLEAGSFLGKRKAESLGTDCGHGEEIKHIKDDARAPT